MYFTKFNNNGIYNEIKFVQLFDGQKVKNLNQNCQNFLEQLYGSLSKEEYIECWKSKYNEKADIKIRINKDIKGISIKMGECNSIHQEQLASFSKYLLNIGIKTEIVEMFNNYILGIVDGNRIDAVTYKKRFEKEILEIKTSLSDLYIKVNLIIRFLFKGKEDQQYDADAIIHGTPQNFLWATKSEILRYLIDYPDKMTVNVKIGPLSIQCRNRNLKHKEIAKNDERDIQVKWHNLKEDLYFITKKRQICPKKTNI